MTKVSSPGAARHRVAETMVRADMLERRPMLRLVVLLAVGLGLAACGLPLRDNPTPFHCPKNGSRTAQCL